jgi:proteasome lid subunit RPN8/RPN11
MLYLQQVHWQSMIDEVNKWAMEEACGMVAGLDQTSQAVYPVTNILHSPIRYRMDPEQQLEVFNQIDDNEWQLLAIYHSHLQGPSVPSNIDIAEAAYPGVIHLIWSPSDGDWICRGYLIEKGKISEVPIKLLEGSSTSLN